MRLDPAVAACRTAVRRALRDLPAGALVLVACSGGADSLALAAATRFVGSRAGLRVGVVTVDHGLQPGSAARADRVAAWARSVDADPVLVQRVQVGRGGGPEAAARAARYRALDAAAARTGATAVLLGHTRDDQAETVLLGLTHGSGGRSLAGMPATRGVYRRPFLTLSRSTTRVACGQLGLPVWDDPHNLDPAFTRTRVRVDLLPALTAVLGEQVPAALARTAELLRADAEALDDIAAAAAVQARRGGHLAVDLLAVLPTAVRTRVLRSAVLAAGVPGRRLTARHIAALDALVTHWHGQGPVDLPGGIRALRRCGLLHVMPAVREERCVLDDDIEAVLVSEKQISAKIEELGRLIDRDYGHREAGRELVLVGVLKGAAMFMADLVRALRTPVSLEYMAVSSYGSSTSSSGVVRILKDLDRDITGADVLVVEDIIDSGLTLSWLLRNLRSRGPASVEVCALLRKPDAVRVEVPVRYMGFDIPNVFVVGYGLDYAQRYRQLPFVGTLRPEIYSS